MFLPNLWLSHQNKKNTFTRNWWPEERAKPSCKLANGGVYEEGFTIFIMMEIDNDWEKFKIFNTILP